MIDLDQCIVQDPLAVVHNHRHNSHSHHSHHHHHHLLPHHHHQQQQQQSSSATAAIHHPHSESHHHPHHQHVQRPHHNNHYQFSQLSTSALVENTATIPVLESGSGISAELNSTNFAMTNNNHQSVDCYSIGASVVSHPPPQYYPGLSSNAAADHKSKSSVPKVKRNRSNSKDHHHHHHRSHAQLTSQSSSSSPPKALPQTRRSDSEIRDLGNLGSNKSNGGSMIKISNNRKDCNVLPPPPPPPPQSSSNTTMANDHAMTTADRRKKKSHLSRDELARVCQLGDVTFEAYNNSSYMIAIRSKGDRKSLIGYRCDWNVCGYMNARVERMFGHIRSQHPEAPTVKKLIPTTTGNGNTVGSSTTITTITSSMNCSTASIIGSNPASSTVRHRSSSSLSTASSSSSSGAVASSGSSSNSSNSSTAPVSSSPLLNALNRITTDNSTDQTPLTTITIIDSQPIKKEENEDTFNGHAYLSEKSSNKVSSKTNQSNQLFDLLNDDVECRVTVGVNEDGASGDEDEDKKDDVVLIGVVGENSGNSSAILIGSPEQRPIGLTNDKNDDGVVRALIDHTKIDPEPIKLSSIDLDLDNKDDHAATVVTPENGDENLNNQRQHSAKNSSLTKEDLESLFNDEDAIKNGGVDSVQKTNIITTTSINLVPFVDTATKQSTIGHLGDEGCSTILNHEIMEEGSRPSDPYNSGYLHHHHHHHNHEFTDSGENPELMLIENDGVVGGKSSDASQPTSTNTNDSLSFENDNGFDLDAALNDGSNCSSNSAFGANTTSTMTIKAKRKTNNSKNYIGKQNLFQEFQNEDVAKIRDSENKYIIALQKDMKIVGYRCDWPECEFLTCRKYVMVNHINGKHTNQRPYSCDMCNFTFVKRYFLKAHMHKVHKRRMSIEDGKKDDDETCSLDNGSQSNKRLNEDSYILEDGFGGHFSNDDVIGSLSSCKKFRSQHITSVESNSMTTSVPYICESELFGSNGPSDVHFLKQSVAGNPCRNSAYAKPYKSFGGGDYNSSSLSPSSIQAGGYNPELNDSTNHPHHYSSSLLGKPNFSKQSQNNIMPNYASSPAIINGTMDKSFHLNNVAMAPSTGSTSQQFAMIPPNGSLFEDNNPLYDDGYSMITNHHHSEPPTQYSNSNDIYQTMAIPAQQMDSGTTLLTPPLGGNSNNHNQCHRRNNPIASVGADVTGYAQYSEGTAGTNGSTTNYCVNGQPQIPNGTSMFPMMDEFSSPPSSISSSGSSGYSSGSGYLPTDPVIMQPVRVTTITNNNNSNGNHNQSVNNNRAIVNTPNSLANSSSFYLHTPSPSPSSLSHSPAAVAAIGPIFPASQHGDANGAGYSNVGTSKCSTASANNQYSTTFSNKLISSQESQQNQYPVTTNINWTVSNSSFSTTKFKSQMPYSSQPPMLSTDSGQQPQQPEYITDVAYSQSGYNFASNRSPPPSQQQQNQMNNCYNQFVSYPQPSTMALNPHHTHHQDPIAMYANDGGGNHHSNPNDNFVPQECWNTPTWS